MNSQPELTRIFNEIKSKTLDIREKAAEDLSKNFKKKYLEFSEEVIFLNLVDF